MITYKFISEKMNDIYYDQWKTVDENQTTVFDGETND